MLYADGALGVAFLALWVYALLDVITSDESRIRNLPKWAWFIVVLLLAEVGIGAVLWFVAGRPRGAAAVAAPGKSGVPAEYDRPGRATASSPDDDAAFLASLKERAEEQRRRAERERRARDADGG